MFFEIDPALVFNLSARYISPSFLKWIILILTVYQILSLIYRCLVLGLVMMKISLWTIKQSAKIMVWTLNKVLTIATMLWMVMRVMTNLLKRIWLMIQMTSKEH
ncbi:TPA_asm: P overlapped [Artemisia alphacytorhabdovirus 3]|nr:TPA_asm: P overlapped [Artemisia alphacytorhabdovirus 3]